ncbi:MAG: ATP-binding protein [Candidatus Muirbacterium halophilum]|nr:ATP-binding protein [Candidatus Muirbacterium halophilum]
MNRDLLNKNIDIFLKGIILFSFFIGIFHIFIVNLKYLNQGNNFVLIYEAILFIAFVFLLLCIKPIVNNNNNRYFKNLAIAFIIIIIPSKFLYKNIPLYLGILEFSTIIMLISAIFFKNKKKLITVLLVISALFIISQISLLPIIKIDIFKNLIDKIIISFILILGNFLITILLIKDKLIFNLKTKVFVGFIYCISLPIAIFTLLKEFNLKILPYENLDVIFMIISIISVIPILNSLLSFFFNQLAKSSNNTNKNKNYQEKLEYKLKELSYNEKLFNTINQNTLDIIWYADKNMKFKYVNQFINSFLGYSSEQILGKTWEVFSTKTSNEIFLKIYQTILNFEGKKEYKNAEIVKRFEAELIKANKETVWTEIIATVIFDENAQITNIIGITRDIDERKKSEILLKKTKDELQNTLKKLSESDRKYKYLVTNSSDVFWTMTPDLKITYVSPKVFDLQGITQEEALKLPFEKKFPHESMQIFMGMAHEILSLQGKPESRNLYYNKTYQLPQYHKDGHIIMTEISLTVIFDENAMALEAIGVTRDISTRIAYQKEIERINRELKTVNDNLKSLDEMKTNLLSNVSHELRTPLASIKGYISMLSSGASGSLNEKQNKYVNIVQKNIEHLISLIETLLSYSRLDLGEKGLKLDNFNINELVEEIFDTVNSKNKFRNPLKLNSFAKKVFVYADCRQIRQVFINLIDNAIKFSQKDSPVEITISDSNENIHIEVKDNGIGIPAEKVEVIFDRFYQIDSSTTRNFQGMGLGLSIVKKILDLHESVANIESKSNIGTSFYFDLKKGIKTNNNESKQNTQDNLNDIKNNNYNINPILVVDDQIEMINFLKELFDEASLPTHVISNSKNAIKYIEENEISLAILDISMAEITGIEICKNIKQKNKLTPVIILSAFSEEKYRNLAKQAKADDYIVKPFDINDLLEKVKKHITK